MLRKLFTISSASAVLLSGILSLPLQATAQSMVSYSSVPPFVGTAVTPNVLLLLDKSGSMGRRAYCDVDSGSTDYSGCPVFDEASTYVGIFDSMQCYTYDATDKRFEGSATAKAAATPAIAGKCANTDWDGNFLNWVTTRRIDSVKLALIGGSCVSARGADGSCPTSGSPAKVTLKGVDKRVYSSGATVSTPAVPTGSGAKKSNGRVPATAEGSASNLYFHVMGGDGGSGWLTGSFCVSNSTTKPSETGSCTDWNAGINEQFVIRAARDFEPRGLIQEAGSRVRFGLMQFKGDDGAFVTVPIGSKQTIAWNGTTVSTYASNNVAMINSVEEVNNEGNTPLAESLYEAARYIAQINSSLFTTQYVYPISYAGGNSNGVALATTGVGSLGPGEEKVLTGAETCPSGYISSACGRDPFFFGSNHTPTWASPSVQVPCCKTFIIVLTDGAPTEDTTIPSAIQDYADKVHGQHCTGGSTTIHNPDGTCNTNPATPPGNWLKEHKTDYGSGSHYLDDVAYWMHTTDLRQATIPVINVAGHDLPGIQNVTVYTFFAFGNVDGREILMQTARQGAFTDIGCDRTSAATAAATKCDIPDKPEEYDQINNNTGAAGADGWPDAYFESATGNDMKDKLLSAVASILQRSSSGTSISVLATSSSGEGSLYQAFFFPSTLEGLKEVKWLGYLQGLFVDAFGNVREDTNGDGKMVYTQDKIIQSRFDATTNEVKVDRFADADGDGKADSTTPSGTVTLKEVVGIWEAGKRLAERDPATRKILTWVDTDNDGKVDAGEQIDFTTANAATLGPYLRAQASPSLYTADNIINYVRGTNIAGLRDRQLTIGGTLKTWKLGDLIHSTPAVVDAPKERFDVLYGDASYTAYLQKYKDRRQVIYAGANDGMLHAFNGGFYHRGDDLTTTSVVEHGWFTRTPTDNSSGPLLGDELWGFVPYQLLPQVQWLADPNYSHVYYVDLKPKVTDARIFTPDTDHPNGWGTILIGGFRMGGSCKNCSTTTGAPEMKVNIGGTDRYFYSAYFILDITNPEVDPKLLWSFADIDLGLTTSYPTVVRVSPLTDGRTDNTNAKWLVAIGSGPTGYGADSSQQGRLYALEIPKPYVAGTALTLTQFLSQDNNSFMGDLIALDANLDYRTDTLYMGNVINTGSTPKWAGKLRRLTMGTTAPFGGQTTVASWGYGTKPTTVLANFACSPTPCSGTTTVGPIPSAPAVTADDANKLWLFFGSGRYYSDQDKSNTDPQYFFGVKDPVVKGTCTQTSDTSCQRNDLINVSGATVCVVCSGGTNEVTGVTGATTLTALQGLVASKDGWYTTLPVSGERSLVAPVILGGIVFFPTFVPDTNICTASGTSYLYALFYKTGSAYKESVIGTYSSGGNTNVKRSTSMGQGMASQVAVHLGRHDTDSASGVSGSAKVCSQSSTGALACAKVNPALASWSRYLSWINQYQ